MRIPVDKKMHIVLGFLLALLLAAVVIIAITLGPGYAVAVGSILLNGGVEGYQKVRGEGEPSWLDAMAGASTGVAAGLGYQLWVAVLG